MSQFVNELIVTPLNDGVNWRLVEDFLIQDDNFGLVRIPKMFVTDGGTIPWAAQNIIKPTGKGFRAFVGHDWCYGTQTMARKDADEFLVRLLHACNFNEVGDIVIYDTLEMFGEIAWNQDKNNIAENLKLLEAV